MTAVFLHGVPETGVIWNGVRARLADAGVPSVALDLPGFGAPRPAGFGATKDEYAQWLATELRGIDGPVDVVGHDWGAGIVLRVVTAFDVPVRSWAVDCASVTHRDVVWHDMAQIWRTPGRGEDWMAAFVAASADAGGRPGEPGWMKTALLASCPTPTDAAQIEKDIDDTMGESILALYRSATPNIFADWGAEMSRPTSAPGLVLRATADDSDDPARSREMALGLGARTAELAGLNHWWMMEGPDATVTALQSFWASLP
ncbi:MULTISPECIES: alpha/beta fold hydrolase [Actinoalloteichus]|uniref:Hydrolase or acyltransferase of alpha/beta superfamily n=1 Tax=Actinoalloteichus fjordicus TaxID=1612552 RepID=A0AAC9PTH1_9PSEU|nr:MULTISPECIES: alpha/beta hydrolase [Actinoalloteichus]APU16669.1 putative hydrolase or acyltransferase of alpha/beta superfamily [Actinoalloteichus fjordicus]APU22735.1 putative hydrolase or acyltransferase of alpha/beta superfamily [Actinoalloteichus sp. GBA129-24]